MKKHINSITQGDCIGLLNPIATFFLVLFSGGILMAQTPLTLETAIHTALNNNKELSAYKLRVEEKKIAASNTFYADKTNLYYAYDQANTAENGHPLHTIGVEQTLPFPTIYGTQNRLDDHYVELSEYEWEKQKQTLIKDITKTYYDICFQQLKMSHLQRIDTLYRKITDGSQKRYNSGDISRLDLLNAQARLQQITLQLKDSETTTNALYITLKTLMQTDSNFVITTQEIPLIAVQLPDLTANADIKLSQARLKTLKTLSSIEKQSLLPDINLNYYYGNNRFDNSRGYHGFQVGLAIPLFFMDASTKIKASKVAVKIGEMQLANDEIMLNAKHNKLMAELQKCKQTIDAYHHIGENLAKEIIHTAEKSYQAGEIDFYSFTQSIENAMKLTTDYYLSVINHNHIALEINYLEK